MSHESLIQELHTRPGGSAINRAFLALASGGDMGLHLAMVKAMTRCGMPGLAVRLLRASSTTLEAGSELATAIEQLEALPSGRVDSTVLERRFRGNVAALLAHRAHLADYATELGRAGERLVVYETSDGAVFAVRDIDDHRFQFALPPTAPGGDVARSIVDPGHNTTAIAMSGVPSPDTWRQLLAVRSASGFRPPLDIVEPSVEALGVWLRLNDVAADLEGPRVQVYAGAEAPQQYVDVLLADPHRMLPTHVMVNHRAGAGLSALNREIFQPVIDRRNHQDATAIRAQDIRYGGLDATHWRDRFRAADGNHPLRVAGFTTRHSTVIRHAMRDFQHAFERAGCQFDLIMEPHDSTNIMKLGQILADDAFDLVVILNHLRFEFNEQIHSGLPFVGWMQDHMPRLWSPEAGANVGELDLVLGPAPDEMASLFGYPRDRFLATGNLTDPAIYDATPLPDEELDSFLCDVSFVSHAAATPVELIETMVGGAATPEADCLHRLLPRLETELDIGGFVPGMRIAELLHECEAAANCAPRTPEQRRAELFQCAMRLYDRLLRHETLQWVADWAERHGRSLRLYGSGWEHHPTLGRYAAGEIANGRDLQALYQASRINLQVNGFGSMHQRLLDGLASGGFMLVRFSPADVVRKPYEVIREAIVNRGLSLDEVMDARDANDDLGTSIREVERFGGECLAQLDDPARQQRNLIAREVVNHTAHQCSDAGLFERLSTLAHLPHRMAGDVPGYDACAFRSRTQLESLLDRYVNDPAARRHVAGPMRASVLEHDTMDRLVERILNHFMSLPADTRVGERR